MLELTRARRLGLGIAMLLGVPAQVAAEAPLAPDDTVVFLAPNLQEQRAWPNSGRWGLIADVQHGLNDALEACDSAPARPLAADGVFGPNTLAALRALADCEAFAAFGIAEDDDNDGRITAGLWQALLSDEPVPTTRERAFLGWLANEALDFDEAQFNIRPNGEAQANDRRSHLTWGPYGATVGWGGEVQRILDAPELAPHIERCFGDEATALRTLFGQTFGATPPDALLAAATSPDRRAAWIAGFACLGATTEVRRAYEDLAWRGAWFSPAVLRLARSLHDERGIEPTEIDFAFFVDMAMHASMPARRVARLVEAVEAETDRLGREPTPAERRRAVGRKLVELLGNRAQQNHRTGRNVVYYVDGIGEAQLDPHERQHWLWFTAGLKASDLGLRDLAYPIR